MGDYVPVYPKGPYSTTASAPVVGGQNVEVTGDNTVGPAGAGSLKVVGQAGYDAGTLGQVVVHSRGDVREATASGAITAGQRLKAAAAGKVAAYVDGTDPATQVVGLALAGAADTAICRYMEL